MKVKYALALALSHRARLLVLDEPTSGLDPVSRDCKLLEIFLRACPGRRHQHPVFHAYHLRPGKCADHIVYLRQGEVAEHARRGRTARRVPHSRTDSRARPLRWRACCWDATGAESVRSALLRAEDAPRLGADTAPASLEDIMVHLEKEEDGGLW